MTNSLTHRERVRLALEHRDTDRVPVAMVCSGINEPGRTQFDAWLQKERGIGVDEYLLPLIDIKTVEPKYIGPPLAPNTDYWGVTRRAVSYGPAAYDEIVHYPLAEAKTPGDLDKHIWPDPDWFDYSVLPAQIAKAQSGEEYCLMVGNGNVFETSWYMRGLEQMFMDLALDTEMVHAILSRVRDFWIEYLTRVLKAADGAIDLVFTADDIGGQEGMLMSLDMWRENIKPHHVQLNKALHDFDIKVIYHTDGAVMTAVPGLIDMGIDILQALQFDAKGMDPVQLKEQHGHELCFTGGVSVQSTLPFGSQEEVTREVRDRIRVLGGGGGYILGPSHAIQVGTPPENIAAMFDTAAATTMGA